MVELYKKNPYEIKLIDVRKQLEILNARLEKESNYKEIKDANGNTIDYKLELTKEVTYYYSS